ncbi:MAG: sigma-70 family RNA polymerase sigma factor [Chthoniobacteraceae bacterium]
MNRLLNARQGDWSALDTYLRELNALPTPTDEEIVALGERATAGDIDAQELLVRAHLRLVVRIAHHYGGFGLPLADLISEGNIGLMRAAELYEPGFGTKFSTYASIWIKQRIHRAIANQSRAVRVPVWRSQRLRKITQLQDEFVAKLGRLPTECELAGRLGISDDELADLQHDRIEVVPLDSPLQRDNPHSPNLHEVLRDESTPVPGSQLTKDELHDQLIACLHDLDDRELEILTRKYGFEQHPPVSFRELGRRWGLSHEWVRRIGELALVKVRRAIEGGKELPPAELRVRQKRVRERMRLLEA